MRTGADRDAVVALYAECLGGFADEWRTEPAPTGEPVAVAAPAGPPQLQPTWALTRHTLQVGSAWLPRAGVPHEADEPNPLLLLPCQLRSLGALMTCVRMSWMAVLVGPPASGKTAVARLLARLVGQPMLEATLSAATDTTELVRAAPAP
jgi:hypothetical protein